MPELHLREIEKIIKAEASLCCRLLRYLNSAIFGFSSRIRLVAAVGTAQQKSSELVLLALVRARFCELLAAWVQHGDSDLLFSASSRSWT